MNKEKTYQLLAVALGILALIFMIMFFTRNDEPVGDRLNEIASNIEECRDRIADWRSEQARMATTTATSTALSEELEDILSDCGEVLREGSEYLGQ